MASNKIVILCCNPTMFTPLIILCCMQTCNWMYFSNVVHGVQLGTLADFSCGSCIDLQYLFREAEVYVVTKQSRHTQHSSLIVQKIFRNSPQELSYAAGHWQLESDVVLKKLWMGIEVSGFGNHVLYKLTFLHFVLQCIKGQYTCLRES